MEANEDIAKEVSEKINIVLSQADFKPAGKVTVSIGITQVVEGDTNESMVKRSDQALYQAKNNGRNRIEII